MENKKISDLIMENYNNLNKLEKKVAQKVMDNPKEIIHMSINEVSKYCDVSDTTVFRLCNKLGFKGFQDFKINLALGIVSPMENIHNEIEENDDNYIIMRKILKSSVSALETTINNNDPLIIEKICQNIIKANKICFWGNGGSSILAEDANHKFYRLNLHVETASDTHWQYMQASLLKKGDIIFLFSNTGANKDLIELVEYTKDKEVTSVAITQSLDSPLAQKTDFCLISCGNKQEYRSEAMESRLSTLLIMDILFIRCFMLLEEKAQNSVNEIRKGIARKRI